VVTCRVPTLDIPEVGEQLMTIPVCVGGDGLKRRDLHGCSTEHYGA
jgi:hypothetical protein